MLYVEQGLFLAPWVIIAVLRLIFRTPKNAYKEKLESPEFKRSIAEMVELKLELQRRSSMRLVDASQENILSSPKATPVPTPR